MQATVRCSGCGGKLQVSPAMIGKAVRCPQCASSFVIRAERRAPTAETAAALLGNSPSRAIGATAKAPPAQHQLKKPPVPSPAPNQRRPLSTTNTKGRSSRFSLMSAIVVSLALLFTVTGLGAGGFYL